MEADEIINYGVKIDFLNKNQLIQVTQKSKRGNIIYDNFCQSLENYYLSYKSIYDSMFERIKVKPHEKNSYLKEFKGFLDEWNTILKDVSIFQIDCLTQIRTIYDDSLDRASQELIQKSETIMQPQMKYQQKLNIFVELIENIQNHFIQFKKEVKEPTTYYNDKIIQAKKKNIIEVISQLKKIENQMLQEQKSIRKNAEEYSKHLVNYRKKLFNNKYYYYDKIIKMSSRSKDCLTQLLILLLKSASNRYEIFKNMTKNNTQKARPRRTSKSIEYVQDDQISTQIIVMTQQYNLILDQISQILKSIIQCLSVMSSKRKIEYQKCKQTFIENLNKLYDKEESPTQKVIDALDLFNYFTQKLGDMIDKLTFCYEDLLKLRQNVKKHADITLSLLKCGSYKDKILPSPKSDGPIHSPLEELNQQMSYDFINAIIGKVYNCYHETLLLIKNFLNKKYYKKKKHQIEDSMEISHLQETYLEGIPKRPFKHQLWLWSDWKDTNYKFKFPKSLVGEVELFVSQFKTFEQCGKQLQSYNCTLFGKKDYKGILKIYQKQIDFVSSDNSISLRIPTLQIDQVEERVQIFQKILVLKTSAGEILFKKFIDIRQVLETLEARIKLGGSETLIAKSKKVKIVLSAQELAFIESRKTKIMGQLEKTDGMMDVNERFIEGVSVDEVYELIYSDNPVTIRGKTQPNFFTYIFKKTQNFNVVNRAYKEGGPMFYTSKPQITFMNCPLYAQRQIEYDHPIPPIPFMPKHCHNLQKHRVYWISHQQIEYVIQTRSSGAPYTQDFYVRMHHKIKSQEKGVKIAIKGIIVFINDIRLKGFIKSKGEGQMIEGGKLLLNEAQKYIKSRVSGGQKISQAVEDKKQQDTKEQSKSNSQISKLKGQNKMLIYGLVGVFLINILIRLIIG